MEDLLRVEDILRISSSNRNFRFNSRVQVIDQNIGHTKYGNPYLILTIRNSTEVMGKVKKWINDGEDIESLCEMFDIGSILEISGEYNADYNSCQVNNGRKLQSNEYNLEDFVNVPTIDIDNLDYTLQHTISAINSSYMKDLLNKIFNDCEIKEKFYTCPASILHHHPYQGGTLQHTIGMVECFSRIEEYYQRNTLLNVDLIYTGLLLHDIGKINEYYIYNGISLINKQFALIGHIILGDQLISSIIDQIENFPQDLENQIRHIILSHHGRKEWGSPVEPQSNEAEIVHYLDLLDSRFNTN